MDGQKSIWIIRIERAFIHKMFSHKTTFDNLKLRRRFKSTVKVFQIQTFKTKSFFLCFKY